MTTPATKPAAPRRAPARKPKEQTPSEVNDAKLEQEELAAELLADLPELRPAARFRLVHRNAFHNLRLDAYAEGAFEGDMQFDMDKPEDIARYKKLQTFVESIDAFAESIAVEPAAYVEWSEGKTEDHFLAIFNRYAEALGESSGSAS
jgi:hypothetical protein